MTYTEPCEEVTDMSGYDLDGPHEYDEELYKKLSKLKTDDMKKKRCVNPGCRWEGLLIDEVRMCPGCSMEIKGWKSAYIEDSQKS